jgi:hypothetical protein
MWPSHFVPNQTYASISWDNGREVRYPHAYQSWDPGLISHRSESTTLGPAMFCRSTPIRQIGRGKAGTTDLFIISISSSIQVPLLPPLEPTVTSLSTIKAGDNIPFVKERLNKFLKIDWKTDFIRCLQIEQGTGFIRKSMRSIREEEESPILPLLLSPFREPLYSVEISTIAKAVKRSSFAVVCLPQAHGTFPQHIFYQDPQLHLRACRWYPGSRRVVSKDREQVLNYIYP